MPREIEQPVIKPNTTGEYKGKANQPGETGTPPKTTPPPTKSGTGEPQTPVTFNNVWIFAGIAIIIIGIIILTTKAKNK